MATMNVNYATIDRLDGCFTRMSTLTGKIGYAIMRTHTKLEPELKIIGKMRDNLVKKYTDGGDSIGMEHENWKPFVEEYLNFMNGNRTDIDVYQVDADQWDDEAVYCETARAEDYRFVKQIIVKQDVENGGEEKEEKPGEGTADSEI